MDAFDKLDKEHKKGIDKLLSESATKSLNATQRKRLGQLDWHIRGVAAFTDPKAEKLFQFDKEQKELVAALAERFGLLIGEPPMQYLTRWRLALGARALKEGGVVIDERVELVGERLDFDGKAPFEARGRAVFALEAVLHDLELQRANGGEQRRFDG